MIEGKKMCSPTWKTQTLIAGGTFAGTMIGGPTVLGKGKNMIKACHLCIKRFSAIVSYQRLVVSKQIGSCLSIFVMFNGLLCFC